MICKIGAPNYESLAYSNTFLVLNDITEIYESVPPQKKISSVHARRAKDLNLSAYLIKELIFVKVIF